MKLPDMRSGWSRFLPLLLLCIPIIWFAILFAAAVPEGSGLKGIIDGMTVALNNPFHLRWTTQTPKWILIFVLAYGMGIAIYFSTRRNYRRGEEQGSAQWGNATQIVKRYQTPKPDENLILTKHFRMGLDGYKHRRNLNVLVIGGSGAGKSRFYARPNIMQCNTSFVITDPKGEALRATGHLLKGKGYDVKVFDLINPGASLCYNPFSYVSDDKDVLRLITNLIKNTTPKGSKGNNPFWEKAEIALLQALMLYLVREAPPEERNFQMILEIISRADVREENNDDHQSTLDLLFERLENKNPDSIALKQYKVFKQSAGKTAKSILISAGVRLALSICRRSPGLPVWMKWV